MLTTLNIPAAFGMKFVLPCRTSPSWFDHVTLGLGNHLLALAARMPFENVNVGAEKAEKIVKVMNPCRYVNFPRSSSSIIRIVTLCITTLQQVVKPGCKIPERK